MNLYFMNNIFYKEHTTVLHFDNKLLREFSTCHVQGSLWLSTKIRHRNVSGTNKISKYYSCYRNTLLMCNRFQRQISSILPSLRINSWNYVIKHWQTARVNVRLVCWQFGYWMVFVLNRSGSACHTITRKGAWL